MSSGNRATYRYINNQQITFHRSFDMFSASGGDLLPASSGVKKVYPLGPHGRFFHQSKSGKVPDRRIS